MIHKENVLILISTLDFDSLGDANNFLSEIQSINDNIVKYQCLIDPTEKELLHHLYETTYLCVIPCMHRSAPNPLFDAEQEQRVNLTKQLERIDIQYFGGFYPLNTLLNDRFLALKSSNIHPPMILCNAQGAINRKAIEHVDNDVFSYSVEHVYKENSLVEHLNTKTIENLEEALFYARSIIKKNSRINNLIIKATPKDKITYIVSIIGSGQNHIKMICESSNRALSCSVKDSIKSLLFSKTLELMGFFEIKNFARFEFIYCLKTENAYLNDIDTSNVLNEYTRFCLEEMNIKGIQGLLRTILLVAISNGKNPDNNHILISKLSQNLPVFVVKEILPLNFYKKIYLEYSYIDVCNELRKRFLFPDESNRRNILRILSGAIERLPKIVDSSYPYLEEKNADYDFLKYFESIPEEVKDLEETLFNSIKILRGQARWHSPTTLYNVFPPTMFNTVAAITIANMYNPNAITEKTSAGLLQMENQVVRQISTLVGWTKNAAGIFNSGGKACFTYAIKIGLNRCLERIKSTSPPIVIASESSHYSISSVCELVGLSKFSIERIPTNGDGTINLRKFRSTLEEKVTSQVPIACIIFSGGNTTHCNIEKLDESMAIINDITDRFLNGWRPYIYFDTVVAWPWFFFKGYDFELNKLGVRERALRKIKHVYERLSHANLADGIGIDFHKLGFCPAGNSLFLTKDQEELHSIFGAEVNEKFREPYHYSINNSRDATAILAAWNMLQSTGIEGIRSYIANMMEVSCIFSIKLSEYGFDIINENSTYGFSLIIWCGPNHKKYSYESMRKRREVDIVENNKYLFYLTEYIAQKKENLKHSHLLRYLPKYLDEGGGVSLSVISVLPMSLNINAKIAVKIAREIAEAKVDFDKKILKNNELSKISKHPVPEDVPR